MDRTDILRALMPERTKQMPSSILRQSHLSKTRTKTLERQFENIENIIMVVKVLRRCYEANQLQGRIA